MTCFLVKCKVYEDGKEPEYEQLIESGDITKADGVKEYIAKHGKHFTNELAEYASAQMVNSNGSAHMWTCEQIQKLLGELDLGSCTIADMTYLANMAYSDFYPEVIPYEESCIKYAIAIAHDKDGYECIAFTRWLSDVMSKELEIDWERFI